MANRLEQWVEECAELTQPDDIYWCDGSEEEIVRIYDECVDAGIFIKLNEDEYPNCWLHRSDPRDVARTEHLTFICTEDPRDAGPTNNWMAPAEAKEKLSALFRGSMKGRTMYVVPYLLGPPGSPFTRVGVEITDSRYVVASMRIMTRMGQIALDELGDSDDFFPGLHSMGDLDPDRRFICHFPAEQLVWSVGSGYGGNALLGKKCFALRIASTIAREQGWLAEHMLILEVEHPDGHLSYISGAFPSACGKTNLAMLVSPLENEGYKVRTLGDDIAWLHPGPDGRLWAINPEFGMFGVAPGTSMSTNPNAIKALRANSLFTNVGLTPDGLPWWEGVSDEPPEGVVDWQGQPWNGEGPVAHPNSRYTTPLTGVPSLSPRWDQPQGVPIDIMLFGGRRESLVPLVYESFDWNHGVFVAASIGSETTAAATGKVGVVRRDPMAMLPFCGYNMADYFAHWLAIGEKLTNPPKIFGVNWFRKDSDGNWLWPGFGENIRPLLWALERSRGEGKAVETPIGCVPTPDALNLNGLDIERSTLEELFSVDRDEWLAEHESMREFFGRFGDDLPAEMQRQLDALEKRLGG